MDCEHAQAHLSADLDGDTATATDAERDDVAGHVETCAACQTFQRRSLEVRHRLRFAAADAAPDLRAAVRDTLVAGSARDRRSSLLAAAAVFVAGALAGAVLAVGSGRGGPEVAAADLARRIVEAQTAVTSLSADLDLVEHGWHADVPERHYSGRLDYTAPEVLHLTLVDETSYPSAAWAPNDVELLVANDVSWSSGLRDCPVTDQPGCTPPSPRTAVVTGREPFADHQPLPLDLVLPVRSLSGVDDAQSLGQATIDGVDAVGVRTTAGQVDALLAGLRPAGNLRLVHPGDVVELWLDATTFAPLSVEVTVGDAFGREAWAADHGYVDRPGGPVLTLRLTHRDTSPVVPKGAAPVASRDAERDLGFLDGAAPLVPDPTTLPEGFELHRSGVTATPGGPEVHVGAWSDGRAWITVRATASWDADRLFGDLGPVVRSVDLDTAGVAFANDRGDRIGLHAEGLDLRVAGSVDADTLVAVAAGLGVVGLPVPGDWPEATTADVDDAVAALDGLLVPEVADGWHPPAVAVGEDVVRLSVAGPGATGYLLTESRGDRLAPPLDVGAVGVEVRGLPGRYSDGRGELEWVEDGVVVSLRSTSLTLGQALAVAEGLT